MSGRNRGYNTPMTVVFIKIIIVFSLVLSPRMFNNVLIDCVHISVEADVNKRVYPLANMPVHLLPLRWHKTIWTRTRERNKKSMHQYLWNSDQCVSNTEPKASKVCSEKSYNYYLIFIRSERKKFAQRRWATVKRKQRGGVGAFPHFIPKPSTLNSKSSKGRSNRRSRVCNVNSNIWRQGLFRCCT